jgi:hypothetical protein
MYPPFFVLCLQNVAVHVDRQYSTNFSRRLEHLIAMSPFVLRQYVESNKSKLDPRIIHLLKNILTITSQARVHGDSETFHTLFEVLRAALHVEENVKPIVGPLYSQASCCQWYSSQFKRRSVFESETCVFQAPTDPTMPIPRSQYSVACSSLSAPDSSFDFLILPTYGFPIHITEIQPHHQFNSSEILRRRAIIDDSYAHSNSNRHCTRNQD